MLREYAHHEKESSKLVAQWEEVKAKFSNSTSHLEGQDDVDFRDMLLSVHGALDEQLQSDQRWVAENRRVHSPAVPDAEAQNGRSCEC